MEQIVLMVVSILAMEITYLIGIGTSGDGGTMWHLAVMWIWGIIWHAICGDDVVTALMAIL